MTTAAAVIDRALKKILVRADEAPIEASEAQDALAELNAYMLSLDARGIKLGYTVVTDLGDEITVPDGAIAGIETTLAVRMAPEFGGTVTTALAASAAADFKALRRLGQVLPRMAYPPTLPIGSGNEDDGSAGRTNFRFYPSLEQEILTENTGSIGVESGTGEAIEGGG